MHRETSEKQIFLYVEISYCIINTSMMPVYVRMHSMCSVINFYYCLKFQNSHICVAWAVKEFISALYRKKLIKRFMWLWRCIWGLPLPTEALSHIKEQHLSCKAFEWY